ncbi:hypothetical protein [Candidatus Liberibacter brunswickensis]
MKQFEFYVFVAISLCILGMGFTISRIVQQLQKGKSIKELLKRKRRRKYV